MSMIITERKNSVLYVTLNRPDVKNAMNADMIKALFECFNSIHSLDRAVVLRGAGEFFCAGGDLQWMKSSKTKTLAENQADALELAKMIRAVDDCPVPVITQVKGGAFGGGVGLVAASDIVMAEETAMFSLSEVKLGLIPAVIGPIVMRKIGYSEARRFYLTGMRFPSPVARHLHLIHEIAPASTFLSVTNHYLNEIASSGPQAVRLAKTSIKEVLAQRLWDLSLSEETSKTLSEIRVGAEAQEGMAAFFEKRAPQWKTPLV